MAKYKIIPPSRTIVQSPISIGHKAEKGVEAIEFDLTAWVETYGSGTLTVIMRRWGDAIPYPIALEIDENNKATWTLSDTDTAKAGMAYAQLNYIVGDEVVKKSDIYTFRVMDSLTGEGDPPEAYESWLEHLTHFAAEAMAEVLDIEGIVTDKTLTVNGGIADAKAAGDALALKADKSTTYTKTEVDQMIETDTTLEIAGAPADAAETGRQFGLIKADLGDLDERIDALESGGGGSGLTDDVKTALMNLVNHLAWDDDDPTGQTYITALQNALYPPIPATAISLSSNSLAINTLNSTQTLTATLTPANSTSSVVWSSSNNAVATVDNGVVTAIGYGTATITATAGSVSATCSVVVAQATCTGITASYTQSGAVYDNASLDDLKADLVVTASWNNGTTSTLNDADYTLSGTLVEGTSTITVAYGGYTDAFSVIVSKAMFKAYSFSDIQWTQGYIDDSGQLVSDSTKSVYDSFIDAEYLNGFALVDSSGLRTGNSINLSEYDANKAFLANKTSTGAVYEENSSTKYVKLGVATSITGNAYSFLQLSDLLSSPAMSIADTSLDTNGAETSYTGRTCSDYISLAPYDFSVYVIYSTSDGVVVCFYDENKSFISRNARGGTGAVGGQIPSNASYVRIAGGSGLSSFLI